MADTTKKRTTAGSAREKQGNTSSRASKSRQTSKGGGKNTKGSKNTKTAKQEEPELGFLRSEVLIICSFAVSILLFLSNFGICGAAGNVVRSIQLGIFGSVGFAVPVLLFIGTCFYMSNHGNIRAAIKMSATAVLLLVLCGFAQLLFGDKKLAEGSLFEFYTASSVSGIGGGFIGGVITKGLGAVVGTAGTYIILLVLLALCIVLITEKSIVKIVKSGSDKAYQYAREDVDRRLAVHAEKVEERKRLREEQRVRGVDLSSTKLGEDTLESIETEEEDIAALVENLTPKEEKPAVADNAAAEISDPADTFTGRITPPAGYSSEKEEAKKKDTYSALSIEPEPEADSSEYGGIYMRRDTRTLEEMDVVPLKAEQEEIYEEIPALVPAEAPEIIPEVMPEPEIAEAPYEMEAVEDTEELNYDSIFVPEEPKRVVTASGKIIETETDLLEKKLEKRKAEAVQENVNEGVRQEIMKKEQQQEIVKKEYIFPPTSLLKKGDKASGFSDKEYRETAIKLQQTLRNFGVGVTVTNISCGPSVTRYELHPEQGVKVSKIVALADDIKLSLAAADIRIEAPIPGKSAVGIEVPNKENNMVYLRDLFESDSFKNHRSRLAFAVGKDIGGQVVVTDIAKMPHLLIAGATGSGKSVCINTLIMSIIYKSDPEDVKLIMVDPKVVELSVYNGIPHLLIPVVTDPKKASGALNWAVAEMTDRYQKFAELNVREINGYNEKIKSIEDIEDANKPKKMPQIVIIIDELADLMMVAPGEVEDSICRLAQLARAAGIHLVIATQRPSVNVITGLIKANVPSRIAFSVSSGVDSRTIIDMNGAEKLLGKGDMLFYPAGIPKPQRVQGAFVSDQEVSRVVEFLTEQGMTADYNPDVQSRIASPAMEMPGSSGASNRDDYFGQAGKFIIEKEKASIGMLQRVFKIGFNRAARIMDQLAEAGVVGEEEGTKPRKVLMTMEEFDELLSKL